MWNTQHKPIPRAHRIDTAITALEQAQTEIFDANGPGDYRAALDELSSLHGDLSVYVRRFEEAMTKPAYSPEMRFEAVGQALRLIRVQFGR